MTETPVPEGHGSIAEILDRISEQLDTVSKNLKATSAELADVKSKQGRQGVRLYLVIVGFILDVILTAVIAVVLFNQQDQSNQLAQVQGRIHDAQISACALGNDFRDQQKQLWISIISLSAPPPNQTPAQKKAQAEVLRKFLVILNKTYAHVNCQALYKVDP